MAPLTDYFERMSDGQTDVEITLLSFVPTLAHAGCSSPLGDYTDEPGSPWYGHALLAFSTVPPDATLVMDPERYGIQGLRQVQDGGVLGDLVEGTYEQVSDDDGVGLPVFSLFRPAASLVDGARYRVILHEDDWADDGRLVEIQVDDTAAVIPREAWIAKAVGHGGGPCGGGGIEVSVEPWGGFAWIHEVQSGRDAEFEESDSVALIRDSSRARLGGGEWIRTRTWNAAGVPGEWSETRRVGGCAVSGSARSSLVVLGLLPLLWRRSTRNR